MELREFDYNLPTRLIAQEPAKPRDNSRLLVLNRETGEILDKHFYDLPEFLKRGDVLVFNDSKVFPARLRAKKKNTGGKIEVLLLRRINDDTWEALLGGRGKRVGLELELEDKKSKIKDEKYRPGNNGINKKIEISIIKRVDNGIWQLKFSIKGKALDEFIERYGETPTPPYIRRISNLKEYQTIYAKHRGSVAAPTAGLHFTKRLMNKLRKMGVEFEFITLHVGLGTFAPVREQKIEKHRMYAEWAEIKRQVAKKLNKAIKEKRRIIAVGTTVVRALESAYKNGQIKPISCWIDLFIYPGYKYKVVDCMITNFHLPKSTLLMLVSAFAGQDKIRKTYQEAIKKNYRFYSFGDAMLIL